MSGNGSAATIILSFQPKHFKLFLSNKKRSSLLVINATCINGARNRIKSGNAALVHIRQPKDVLCKLASSMLLQCTDSINDMKKGCRVEADATKKIVVKAHANIERNRKGDRLIECVEILCVQDDGDATTYLPVNNDDEEYLEYITGNKEENPISLKVQRSKIFADWLIATYGKDLLCRGTGLLDVAGGDGATSRHLIANGIPVTLLDPNPRCGANPAFGIIPHPLNGDGSDLIVRDDEIGNIVRNCSFVCGLHPDQATEPCVSLAERLNVKFAILPCCVMPSLFPHRVQRKHGDPVRSYSAFCQYLLDMAPDNEEFLVDHLPFVGRNKVIYRSPHE